VEIVAVGPGALDASGVSMILVDSACRTTSLNAGRVSAHASASTPGCAGPGGRSRLHQRIIGRGRRVIWRIPRASEVRLAIEIVQGRIGVGPAEGAGEVCSSCLPPRGTGRQSTSEVTGVKAQVLKLLVDGQPNRVIAKELSIDLATVKKHVSTLMRKVG